MIELIILDVDGTLTDGSIIYSNSGDELKKFDVKDIIIVHRYGKLRVGENIVLIAVSSAHRKDAFRACEYLIDELKNVAPIWEKEIK